MTATDHKCGDQCADRPHTVCAANPDRYLELLHKTPVDTVCPNFYLLDHARGCRFECSYCFLKDMEYDFKKNTLFTDKERLLGELSDWVARDGLESYLANAGNMADSLAFENERPLWGDLVEFMREHAEKPGRPHTLLAVTKAGGDKCGAFFGRPPCRNVIISFSVNAPDAAADHEKGAATPHDRLEAAARLKKLGWRVRIRIDPMLAGYEYADIVERIRELAPERVTLGSLRADPTLEPMLAGADLFRRLEPPREDSIGRYPLAERLAMYRPVVERLRDVTSLGLCEETPDVWDALGLDRINKTCNCNPL